MLFNFKLKKKNTHTHKSNSIFFSLFQTSLKFNRFSVFPGQTDFQKTGPCVLEQRQIYSMKSTGDTQEAVASSRHD